MKGLLQLLALTAICAAILALASPTEPTYTPAASGGKVSERWRQGAAINRTPEETWSNFAISKEGAKESIE